jgi:hypothetical protein
MRERCLVQGGLLSSCFGLLRMVVEVVERVWLEGEGTSSM